MVTGKLDHSWKDQKVLGERGVLHIIEWLYTLPKTTGVWDVQDDKAYQTKDIDLLWSIQPDDKELTVEVKTDTYSSGNFFFETISNVSKNTLGCFLKTEADFIFYYFINMGQLYVLDTGLIQKWFLDNKTRYNEKKIGTDNLYQSKGYAIPIKDVPKECIRYHVGDYT